MYISSADWMTRNLDYRIEAAVRINNKDLKKELKEILNIQLHDNVKARDIGKNLKTSIMKMIKTFPLSNRNL